MLVEILNLYKSLDDVLKKVSEDDKDFIANVFTENLCIKAGEQIQKKVRELSGEYLSNCGILAKNLVIDQQIPRSVDVWTKIFDNTLFDCAGMDDAKNLVLGRHSVAHQGLASITSWTSIKLMIENANKFLISYKNYVNT